MKEDKELHKDYLINQNGEKILKEYISDTDLKREELVQDVFSAIENMEKAMLITKERILKKIKQYYKEIGKINKIKIEEDVLMSNIVLKSYDGTKEIKIYQNDIFNIPDDQLKIAEKCFLNYISRKKAEGLLNKEIEQIVIKAFCLDRKRGISKTRILDLIKIQIDDKEWAKGVRIIKDALKTDSTKEYINFRRRKGIGEALETINLNFASM